MTPHGLNSFLLMSIGAGFFALSFNKGRVGKLKQSVAFAILAFSAGILKAFDDGFYKREIYEIFTIICLYALLPLLAVMISRRLYEASVHK